MGHESARTVAAGDAKADAVTAGAAVAGVAKADAVTAGAVMADVADRERNIWIAGTKISL